MSSAVHKGVLQACFKVMRSLARVLLMHGVSYAEFDRVCRRAFVETASEEFGVRGRPTNSSRISAMTGISRKEVGELRRLPENNPDLTSDLLSPLADLIHIWHTSDKFSDGAGNPKPLYRSGVDEESFDLLVKNSMGDVPPGAVVAELKRLGVIAKESMGELTPLRRSLIPPDLDLRLESSIHYSLANLAETIAHNNDPRISEEMKLFERFVESKLLNESQIEALRPEIRRRLTLVTEELDMLLSGGEPATSEAPVKRIGIGIYYSE